MITETVTKRGDKIVLLCCARENSLTQLQEFTLACGDFVGWKCGQVKYIEPAMIVKAATQIVILDKVVVKNMNEDREEDDEVSDDDGHGFFHKCQCEYCHPYSDIEARSDSDAEISRDFDEEAC